ncbi:MAG: hypothetical protein ABIS07_17325 [Dokdonella sp.]
MTTLENSEAELPAEVDDALPWAERTPTSVAWGLLRTLEQIYDTFPTEKDSPRPERTYRSIVLKSYLGEIYPPEAILQVVVDKSESKGWLAVFFAATEFCVIALRAAQAGDSTLAWSYVVEASVLTGIASTMSMVGQKMAPPIAHLGAKARHAGNRAMKQQAVADYLENATRYGSKDAAAEAIAGKVVPVKFRTVRDWLKNLPRAGTP